MSAIRETVRAGASPGARTAAGRRRSARQVALALGIAVLALTTGGSAAGRPGPIQARQAQRPRGLSAREIRILARLDHHTQAARADARRALVALGPRAAAVARRALAEPSARVKRAALRAIVSLRATNLLPEVLLVVCDAWRDNPSGELFRDARVCVLHFASAAMRQIKLAARLGRLRAPLPRLRRLLVMQVALDKLIQAPHPEGPLYLPYQGQFAHVARDPETQRALLALIVGPDRRYESLVTDGRTPIAYRTLAVLALGDIATRLGKGSAERRHVVRALAAIRARQPTRRMRTKLEPLSPGGALDAVLAQLGDPARIERYRRDVARLAHASHPRTRFYAALALAWVDHVRSKYAEAAATLEEAFATLDTTKGGIAREHLALAATFYARALARLDGRERQALAALQQALDLGYADLAWLTANADFASLRERREFTELIERARRALASERNSWTGEND